jgi:hypothetical protein
MRRTFLLALAMLLAACGSKRDMSGQASRGFLAPSFEVLWDVAGREMARAGYPPDQENSTRESQTLVSRWQVQLMPFGGKGIREQATVYLHPVSGETNRWTVEANVTREHNMNQKDPGNAAVAEWKQSERVPGKERQIVYGIETFFIGHEVSPRFRTDYDMPGAPAPVTPPAGR